MVRERRQRESDRTQQCEALIEQVNRKNDQVEVARARLLATRKAGMLGRTGNAILAEQRRKASQQN